MRVVAFLVVVVVVLAALVHAGVYNVAADEPHAGPVRWFLSYVRGRSIATRAADISVPDLSDPALRRAGARRYESECAHCHLAPGMAPTAVHEGLNPEPPELARHGLHGGPAQTYWIIRHGIRMTGMPSWSRRFDEQAIWSIVAFLDELPRLTPEAYRAMSGAAPQPATHGSGAMRSISETGPQPAR